MFSCYCNSFIWCHAIFSYVCTYIVDSFSLRFVFDKRWDFSYPDVIDMCIIFLLYRGEWHYRCDWSCLCISLCLRRTRNRKQVAVFRKVVKSSNSHSMLQNLRFLAKKNYFPKKFVTNRLSLHCWDSSMC